VHHRRITVTLRCAPCGAMRRRASLEGRRPSCISAVHPSRLAARRIAPRGSHLRMTGPTANWHIL